MYKLIIGGNNLKTKKTKKVHKVMSNRERKGIYSIEEVLSKTVSTKLDKKYSRVDFDGDLVYMNSQRYELFKVKGVECVCCGVVGSFFAKERLGGMKKYHFNLYAIDGEGDEVLMTKDHIIRKSDGGIDHLTNYQPMCMPCNRNKR